MHGPPQPAQLANHRGAPGAVVAVPAPRPPDGRAGLDNLGCTCYLNSMLQVLAAEPAFRGCLFKLDPGAAPLARELQMLAARLRGRDAASVNPRAFIDTLTYEGRPVDVRAQQDAEEFLANLFQEIERLPLLDEEGTAARLLTEAFGGTEAMELRSTVDASRSSLSQNAFFTFKAPRPSGSSKARRSSGLQDDVSPKNHPKNGLYRADAAKNLRTRT